jgi:hypothetical protein
MRPGGWGLAWLGAGVDDGNPPVPVRVITSPLVSWVVSLATDLLGEFLESSAQMPARHMTYALYLP